MKQEQDLEGGMHGNASGEQDLIREFMGYTEGLPTPDIFRLWSAITLISGALQRRVWLTTRKGAAYPNLYVILMAPPGVGKSIINEVQDLWRSTNQPGTKIPAFKLASDSVTTASLMDNVAGAKFVKVPPKGPAVTSHHLLIAAEEFSVFFPDYDKQFLAKLNSMFNGVDVYQESRRTGAVKELSIENPMITLLAGYQPALMATTFPEEAWASGFARRLILVYSGEAPYVDIFEEDKADFSPIRTKILARLSLLSDVYGEITWGKGAKPFLSAWDKEGRNPRPTHSKLVAYERSRLHFVIKLAAISSFSRGFSFIVEVEDCKRAMQWLLDVESVMPDVFRAMMGRSDIQLIEELGYFVRGEYGRHNGRPIFIDKIWEFLAARAPSDKCEKVLNAATRADYISRLAGTDDQYVPGRATGTYME